MKKIIILVFSLILLGLRCQSKNPTIGGNRDEHGCLGPAGYSYDASIDACTRNWEIKTDDQKRATKVIIDDIKDDFGSYGLTIIDATKTECEGCFDIQLQRYTQNGDSKTFIIKMKNWVVETIEEITP